MPIKNITKNLENHFISNHKDLFTVLKRPCAFCGKMIDKSNISRHRKGCIKLTQCNYCDGPYRSFQKNKHIIGCNLARNGIKKCLSCEEIFTTVEL